MIRITLEFENEAEANRWLNQRPWTPPPTDANPSEFSDEKIDAMLDALGHWRRVTITDDNRQVHRNVLRSTLHAAGISPS